MSKVKTVMVDGGGIISYPQNFTEANNLASFGTDVDAEFKDITSHGTLNFGSDTSKINFWGVMSLGINNSEGAPYGVIDSDGIGLKICNTILNGLSFYNGTSAVMQSSPFASISTSGFTTVGNLSINQSGTSGWEFKNGIIRNWDKYCDSEIKTNNISDDSGAGYSTINLIAKNYSQGSLADSISIGLNGSTKTVTVSDNATVKLPITTTIGDILSFGFNPETGNVSINPSAYSFELPGYYTNNEGQMELKPYGINDSNTKLQVDGGVGEISLTAPKVSISDTFEIPVYTCDESGNYTKVANETKTVRCIKNDVNGKVTYTLELA